MEKLEEGKTVLATEDTATKAAMEASVSPSASGQAESLTPKSQELTTNIAAVKRATSVEPYVSSFVDPSVQHSLGEEEISKSPIPQSSLGEVKSLISLIIEVLQFSSDTKTNLHFSIYEVKSHPSLPPPPPPITEGMGTTAITIKSTPLITGLVFPNFPLALSSVLMWKETQL